MSAMLVRALQRWRALSDGSVNRRIFSATLVTAGGLFVVKLMAMVKESVTARQFGLGDDVDAFLIAFVVPAFAINVIAGSFNAAFVPAFIRAREAAGEPAARRLFANVMLIDLGLLAAFAALLALFAPLLLDLVAGAFLEEKRALATRIYFLVLPCIVLQGLVTLWGAVLNASEKFALAALSPILTPLAVIAALLLAAHELGGEALAWGTLSGMLAELIVLGLVLHRRRLLPWPRWHGFDASTRGVMLQYLPIISGAAIVSASPIVDQTMAAWLAPGSVAALNFGNKVPAFITGLGVTALGTAVLPYFSKMVARQEFPAIRHTLKTYTRLILAATVPATLLLILTSEPLVYLLYERGAFHASDTELVSQIQRMYLLQTPFYVLGILGVRLLNALSKNHLLIAMATVNLVVNVVGNLVFIKLFGLSGIALSSAVVHVCAMSLILFSVFKVLPPEHG